MSKAAAQLEGMFYHALALFIKSCNIVTILTIADKVATPLLVMGHLGYLGGYLRLISYASDHSCTEFHQIQLMVGQNRSDP